MKNLWIKISYFWFVIILFLVGLFTNNLVVKAEEVNYTYGKWRANNNGSWTGPDDFGTNASSVTLNGISARFGWSTKFQAGTTYRMVVDSGFASYTIAAEDIGVLSPISVNCYGSTSTSSWSADASLIANCDYIGATRVTNSNHVKYIIDITPLSTIIGLQVNINYDSNDRYTLSSVNVYKSSSISYGESVSGAIDEQTIVIQNEFNDLEQTIINNNQTLIDSITENDKVCKLINVSNTINGIIDNLRLDASGNGIVGNGMCTTDYIPINEDSTILQTGSNSYYSCFYDSSYLFISCFHPVSSTSNTYISIPENANFFRVSMSNGTAGKRELFKIKSCTTGNQGVNDSINDFKDTLTNDNVDDPNSSIEDMQDMLPTNGTITQLIALPITLYQKVLNSINGTCQQFNLGSLYGTNLIIPCIEVSTYLGSGIWNTIDLIISGAFVLVIAKKMIKAFENFTSMKEGDVIND